MVCVDVLSLPFRLGGGGGGEGTATRRLVNLTIFLDVL